MNTQIDSHIVAADTTEGASGEAAVPVSNHPGSSRGQTGPTLSLDQILDATAECLAESGYDGTTIRRIAARLSCAVGSIYRYCSDKRALLSQVTQRRFDPVVQAVDDFVPLPHTVLRYAQVAAEDPQQYRLMFWLASLDTESHPDAIPPVVRRIIDGWTRQLGDPRAAERLWSQVHGQLMLGHAPQAIVDGLNLDQLRPGRSPEAAEAAEPQASEEQADERQADQRHTVLAAASVSNREDLTLL